MKALIEETDEKLNGLEVLSMYTVLQKFCKQFGIADDDPEDAIDDSYEETKLELGTKLQSFEISTYFTLQMCEFKKVRKGLFIIPCLCLSSNSIKYNSF
jgi:hypothetical protein